MRNAPNLQRQRATMMLVLATLYWGVSFPIIKTIAGLNHILVPGAGTWFLAAETVAPRFTLAALIVFIINRGRQWPTRAEMVQGALMGVFASGGSLLQTDALQFTPASTSAFLTQLSAIFIPAYLALRYWRVPPKMVWIACALVIVGVAVLGHVSWNQLTLGRGEWETVACAVFFAGQIVVLGEKQFASSRPGMITLSMFSVEAVIFLGLSAFTAPDLKTLAVPWTSMPRVGLTLVLSIICTVGAFSLMNVWQPKITSTQAGLIYCIEPLFASVFALFLPRLLAAWSGVNYANEMPTWSLFVGGGLITFANILVLAEPAGAASDAG
jgi:drug/metabolite transporter (DMT)-like permease